MQRLELTLPEPAANLALDEALLLAAEAGTAGSVLRLWELPTHAIVLGAAGSLAIDVNEAACAADGVPILRRSSGGGTVVIGPGSLNFSLVLPYDFAPRLHEIVPSIRYVLGRVARALSPELVLCGISDLTLAGRKVSGNSQQRKRKFFLHHGTLLCGFDLDRIGKYLNAPERSPDYRAGRGHGEFIATLPFGVDEAREMLKCEWPTESDYVVENWETVEELLNEKYRTEAWIRRR